jgi:hypothetical protein
MRYTSTVCPEGIVVVTEGMVVVDGAVVVGVGVGVVPGFEAQPAMQAPTRTRANARYNNVRVICAENEGETR